jgi:flagellar motor switch protein FliM
MVMGSERVMLIAFEVTIQSVTGTMNIYVPFTLLKPIANLLNPYVFFTAGKKEGLNSANQNETAVRNLSEVTLPVRVLLGNASISFADLVDLAVGDLIVLDQPVEHDLPVKVGDQTRFLARPGKKGSHLAVQITSTEVEDLPGGKARTMD